MTEAFMKCKGAYRHAWDDYHPIGMTPPSIGWRLSLRCTRCTMERHDVIHARTGQLLSREYRRPEGYVPKVPTGRMNIDQRRIELFARLKTRLQEENAIGGKP